MLLDDAVRGDLVEERTRRARVSKLAAAIWYWRTSFALSCYVIARSTTDAIRGGASTGFGLRGLGGEIRHAARALAHAPWYSATVIGVIALSMTFATATFAIVDGILFKPLPYANPAELYHISGAYTPERLAGSKGVAFNTFQLSVRDIRDLEAAIPGSRFTIYSGGGMTGSSLGDLRAWVPLTSAVDSAFFDVMGMRPIIGGFSDADFVSVPGAPVPAIISHAIWMTEFAGRADVVGTRLSPGRGTEFRVAGVMPAEFVFPGPYTVNMLTPLVLSPAAKSDRARRSFFALARLPGDRPLETHRALMTKTMQAVRAELPESNINGGLGPWDDATPRPLAETLTSRNAPTFTTAMTSALALMLLGCLNISGLMASRVLDRQRVLVLRRALGAGSARIAASIAIEAALLVVAGALLALALAAPVLSLAVNLMPAQMSLLKTPGLDWRVFGFVGLACAASLVIVSIWPVIRATRQSRVAAPTDGGYSVTRARSVGRFSIVAMQVGLGLVLTLGGALVVGSMVQIWRTDIGFSTADLLAVEGTYRDRTSAVERVTAVNRLANELRQLPGVDAVGGLASGFLRRGSPRGPFRADSYAVLPGFFDVIEPRLLAGRLATDAELTSGAAVAVVSRAFAERQFGGGNAVGQTLTPPDGGQSYSVIGVVEDLRLSAWDSAGSGAQMFVPATPDYQFTLLVRAGGNTARLVPEIVRLADQLPALQVRFAAGADALLVESVRQRRFQTWLFGAFAAAALTIVGIGVLGLIALTVARRTREIGLRLALGATRDGVVRLLVREQLPAVLTGLAAGATASLWTVALVRSYLYEITTGDVRVWSIAIAIVLATAVAGAMLPALRASRIDPIRSLRTD
ncbi:MAG TPA: ABC transporter permease [Vicinamibacterales bacterium]|nr:ABC transporter permease [Vicinamibacterales bacterium]